MPSYKDLVEKAKNNGMERVTIHLRAGDYTKVGELFPELRAGPAIRQIISAFVDRAEAAAQTAVPDTDVQL